MTTARISLLVLVLGALGAGCGGAGAALQVQPYPGDRDATPRRLESLARQFEDTYGCTEEDLIDIQGLSPGVYSVTGCNASADYSLACRPGRYGSTCGWTAVPSVAQRASIDLACGAEYVDVEAVSAMQRVASGCGRRGTYVLRCSSGACNWTGQGGVEQTGAGPGGTGAYTY